MNTMNYMKKYHGDFMKLNSKAFLKKVQDCLYEDEMSILDTIMAIQEKYEIHFDDMVEMLKQEKTP